ncbi:histone-lysine N-methyltransferase SETMAR [Trichonephila clavipes]|nr:histone-lysine N-methyltransferase SETMAR [Trichonephila clavipes]
MSKVGFKKKPRCLGAHQLTPKNMMYLISICEALAKRNEIDPFLKRMVTGDEKWVTYDNIVRKRSWSKRDEAAQTVAKPPGLTSRKDKATPRTSVVTRQKLWELGWEVLIHPPYSPDLAPNECQLFLALQNFLSDKKLVSKEDCENRLLEFFAMTSMRETIRSYIPLKWQQIIQQNGTYWTQIGQSETFSVLLDCPTVSSEKFVAEEDDVYTHSPNYGKDILEFVQSSKNTIGADSDDENEMNNTAPVATSSKRGTL